MSFGFPHPKVGSLVLAGVLLLPALAGAQTKPAVQAKPAVQTKPAPAKPAAQAKPAAAAPVPHYQRG